MSASITQRIDLKNVCDLTYEGVFSSDMPINIEYVHEGNYIRLMNKNLEYELIKIDYNNPNFIHDCVSYAISGQFKTDMTSYGLTPDFVSEDFLLEISTSSVSDFYALEIQMQSKLKKYAHIANGRKVIVIVISYDLVVSNYEIKKNIQMAMTSNFCILKRLQSELLMEGKTYWTTSSETKFSRKLSTILQNYVPKNHYDGKKQAFDLIDQVWENFDYDSSLGQVLTEVVKHVEDDITTAKFIEKPPSPISFPTEGRTDLKRITVIPMICPEKRVSLELLETTCVNSLIAESKIKIIEEGKITQKTQIDFATPMTHFEIMSGYYEDKREDKKERKGYQFKPELTPKEMLELNLDGVMAKEFKDKTEIIEKRQLSKIPFSFNVDTQDIENFRLEFAKLLDEKVENVVEDQAYGLMRTAYSCMIDAHVNMIDQGENVIKEHNEENSTKFINWLNFVSDLMFEINLSLRENTKNGFFIVKSLKRFQADVYIKTTNSNSHIFFFVVCKVNYILSDTLGPKFVTSDGILVTEWGSLMKRDLENFLSCKETIRSTFCCYDEIFDRCHNSALINAKWLSLMIFLSNKDRNEEIVTSLRYTYMKSLSITEHSSTMNKKLGLLMRDRLQVYLTNKVYLLNNFLTDNKPQVSFDQGTLEVHGMKDLFGSDITFKEGINISYAGYIMTKVKQPQSNQSSKMIEKILDYEIKFLNVKAEEISTNELNIRKDHCFDYKYVRTFSELGKELLYDMFGNQLDSIIRERITSNLMSIDFESIATLKASAKFDLRGKYSEENLEELKSARPRVMSNIVKLINTYKPEHFIELVEPCISYIVNNNCFNVELFPKDQHNGLREIYVVDIHARIVQLFVETISRSLCSFFQSETLNHPKNSTALIPKTLKYSLENNGSPFCLMKSGDASKWSQSQIVTKFYIVLKTFLPQEYHKIVKDALSLWFDKKIFLPPSLIESFMSTNFHTSNVVLNDLREGNLHAIKKKEDMFMTIQSGFMQGILHHSSSLFHTIVQEGFRQIQFKILRDAFNDTIYKQYLEKVNICVLQGSDDSSMAIMGDSKLFHKHKELFLSLMHLKDSLSYKFGIIPSAEKTATCVPFIIEYNSQWLAMGKSIQPTIKFAMVACQLPSAQSIIQRQEFYYNLLKDCLEKGCTTYTCFKIKLNQLCAYYNLLGCNNTSSFQVTSKLLKECLNPSLGFFMLEPIVATAVFGFDFNFYCHTQGALVKYLPNSYKTPMENNLPSGNTLRLNTHISKSGWKKWKQLVEEVGELSSEEEQYLENNPMLYYEKSRNDVYSSVIKIKQKCQDFDVKQSLSSRYGITENMASFFCTFIKVCKIGKEKDSLVGWMLKCTENGISDLSQMFPKFKLYNEIIHYISVISNQSYLVNVDYIQRGRSQITVLHNKTSELELFYDTVKNVWFDVECDEITKDAYRRLFREYMEEFDWLKWTEKETKAFLNCSSRQLANYVRNVVGKNRTLTFFDTVAKGSNYPYLLTRIFQKDKKIQIVTGKDVSVNKNDIIFSNMKILLNLPYKESYKMKMLKELIPKLDLSELTSKEAKKYKILKLVLSDKKEDVKNELFKYSFENHLTWYSQAQHFNKENKSWEGMGCLTTIISTLTIKTIIMDSLIQEIIVNDLSSFKLHLDVYMKIIKEHKLELGDNVDNDLKLSKYGISKSFKGSKIRISPELKSNVAFLENSTLALTNGNMKLVVPMIDIDSNFKEKRNCVQTLYLIESKRLARTFQERRDADHNGYIIENIWIDSRSYNKVKHGEIVRSRMIMGGKDVKLSTIMNFEVWKKITLPTNEKLFDWGELGEKIVKQESLDFQSYVLTKLESFPKRMPTIEMFHQSMEQNHFDCKEYLNFISRVEFFQQVEDPDYDELVKKDKEEEFDKTLIDRFNELVFNTQALKRAIQKTVEFDSCLINLDNVLMKAQTDFSYCRHLVYGVKDTETTFPNTLFYKFNHELRRRIPNNDELLEVMSKGDSGNLLTIYQQIALNLLFATPTDFTSLTTVKSLREFILLGYKPKESRSSRSSTRLGIYLPNNDLEQKMLSKFQIHPKSEHLFDLLNAEQKLLEDAIDEVSQMIEKTTNRRVKMPLLTQVVGYEEDLKLLKDFRAHALNLENEKESESTKDSLECLDNLEESDISLSAEEEDDDLTHSLADSDESADIGEDFNLLNHLQNSYKEKKVLKRNCFLYLNVDITYILRNPKFDIKSQVQKMNCTFHLSDMTILVNGAKDFEVYWPNDDSAEFSIFYHSTLPELPYSQNILSKKIKKISPLPGGSCLFNCFVYLLSNHGKYFKQEELRQIVHDSDHLKLLDEDPHKKAILSNDEWGQEEDIETICHELDVSVLVVTDYAILQYNETGQKIGILINYENVHFDVLE
nr:RNA-dependent RNA polymerase [Apple rubbery wood virus 2]